MLYVQFITDGCSTGEEFKNVWRTAKNSYGENSWQFNKYLWENWYCQQTGGHPNLAGYIKALDAQAETFFKGVTVWNMQNCYSRTNLLFFTPDEINTYWTCGTNGFTFARTSSNEEGTFTTFNNSTLETQGGVNGDINLNSSTFLSTARNVWQKIYRSSSITTYGGTTIVPQGPNIDCSSYVSWVLYEYGYTEFEGWQRNTETFYNTNWNSNYGWTEIPVGTSENPINKVQPGDLFVRYESSQNINTHHITLVVKVENGRVYGYDCGDDTQPYAWKESGGEPIDTTWFFSGTLGRGKIIRVTAP